MRQVLPGSGEASGGRTAQVADCVVCSERRLETGRLWETVGGDGRLWETMGDGRRLWEAVGDCGRRWETVHRPSIGHDPVRRHGASEYFPVYPGTACHVSVPLTPSRCVPVRLSTRRYILDRPSPVSQIDQHVGTHRGREVVNALSPLNIGTSLNSKTKVTNLTRAGWRK